MKFYMGEECLRNLGSVGGGEGLVLRGAAQGKATSLGSEAQAGRRREGKPNRVRQPQRHPFLVSLIERIRLMLLRCN